MGSYLPRTANRKHVFDAEDAMGPTAGVVVAEAPLHRKLKSRHLQMIAIGGIIGPGLLVGSGNALTLAGPAGILISFILVGLIVFFVMWVLALLLDEHTQLLLNYTKCNVTTVPD